MMQKTFINVLLSAILFYNVTTLNVVPGMSGEEQVKEALKRAQKESEEAAGNDKAKSTIDNERLVLKHYYEGGANRASSPTADLVSVLTKKFEAITKDHHNHVPGGNGREQNAQILSRMTTQKFSQGKDNSGQDADSKMFLIANKLNNLMQKFQRKIGTPVSSYLTKHGKLSSHPQTQMSIQAFLSHKSLPQIYREESGQVKSMHGHKADIDLSALRKALGLLHKGSEKGDDGNEDVNSKTSYKEDTKLEDKLALEAEEEKKFSNSENYEYGMGEGGKNRNGATTVSSVPEAISPKDQASKEMQSYNDLISNESNRELNQIQEEITKATQSSLGDVSVVGQKEHVSTEPPGENPLGGIGSLDGVDGMGQMGSYNGGSMEGGGFSNGGASMKGAIDANQMGPVGNTESFPGSSAANEALEASLRASANADMNGQSMPSDNEPTPGAPGGAF